MKVCLMNESFPPVLDGVANVVINYANYLQKDFGQAFRGGLRWDDLYRPVQYC